ncbi:MAG: anthranilate phosphoribosyltransferase, partial [Sulfuricurvum sp.]
MNATNADFEALFEHRMSDEEMREFLSTLPLNESTSSLMIATAAEVMRSHSIILEVPSELKPKLIDVVGTGGDKSGSFNVSSTVALVLAASGAYVAKHGNRSITSK